MPGFAEMMPGFAEIKGDGFESCGEFGHKVATGVLKICHFNGFQGELCLFFPQTGHSYPGF